MNAFATLLATLDPASPAEPGFLDALMHQISLAISIVGVGVVVYGVVRGFLMFLKLEAGNWRGRDMHSMRDKLRSVLGFYLLLGLEFLIAADIIETILDPSVNEVLILGGIVVIRTVISVSLNRELKEAKESGGESEPGEGSSAARP